MNVFANLAWVEQQTFSNPLEKLLLLRLVASDPRSLSEYGFLAVEADDLAKYCCCSAIEVMDALEDLERRHLIELLAKGSTGAELVFPWWDSFSPPRDRKFLAEYQVDIRHEMRRCQEDRCWYCGANLTDCGAEPHIEHQVPLSRGGPDLATNYVLSCPTCNFAKGSKTVAEFRRHVIQRDKLSKTYRFWGESR